MAAALMGMMMQFQENMAEMERMRHKLMQHNGRRPGKRCFDYDKKGFCNRGSSCPYEHINDEMSAPDQYDPSTASLSTSNGHSPSPRRGRRKQGDSRAPFSMAGPNRDRSNTTIVIESIPEDHFTEDAVRHFFSEFGTIAEVTMQPYKRLAIVKYEDFDSATRAWKSPKTIFDNRFVKVYWYKPDSHKQRGDDFANGNSTMADASNGAAKGDEDMIDMVEFTAKQAEAQKAYEDKMKKLKDAEAQREEVERKLREQADERRELMQKLAAKTKGKDGELTESGDGLSIDEQDGAATDALKAKLAALEAEAASIGLDPLDPSDSAPDYAYGFRGRGRGTYRGRGGYALRGRGGYDPSRGGYRGRGNHFAANGRGGVMRWDNRPKRVNVALTPLEEAAGWEGEKDEALRSYLFVRFGCLCFLRWWRC